MEEKIKEENVKIQFNAQSGNPLSICQHCYCGTGFYNNQEHLICCMCGHRTLKNPITY